jgi:hypothetical protein
MRCKDCGHEISVNKICEGRIQSATDMLKHMAAHNASRAFAIVQRDMRPEPEAIPAVDPIPALSAVPWIASSPESVVVGGHGSKELDKKTNLTRINNGIFRSRIAAGVCTLLVCLCFTTPSTSTLGIWFAMRWSLGGGVASTRSQGVCERRNDFRLTAQANP